MKKNKKYKFLTLLTITMLYLYSCQVDTFYYISNHSSKEIKVLFIDNYDKDTLDRFILEPIVSYNFYDSYQGVEWVSPKDTFKYGMKLIITQDGILSNKEYWNINWESFGKNKVNLNINDEDF